MLKAGVTGILIGIVLALPFESQAQQATTITPQEAAALQRWLDAQEAKAKLEQLTFEAMSNSLVKLPMVSAPQITLGSPEMVSTATTASQPPPPGQGPYGNGIGTPSNNSQFVIAAALWLLEIAVIGFVVWIVAELVWQSINAMWDKIFGLNKDEKSPPAAKPPFQTNNPAIATPALAGGTWNSYTNFGRYQDTTPSMVWADITTNGWLDPIGGLYTNVMETTIQTRPALTAPWTNWVTYKIWSSTKGRLLLVLNGSAQPIYTNFAFMPPAGQTMRLQTPILDTPQGVKFYRSAAVNIYK